jgi:hypothetical protein
MPRSVRLLGRRIIGCLGAFAFVLAAGAAPAGAAPQSHLVLSPTAGPPNTPLTVLGSGCQPWVPLAVSFDNQVIGTTMADPSGGFDTTIVTPAAAVAGARTITVSGPGCRESADFEIQAGVVQDTLVESANNDIGMWEVASGLVILAAVLVLAIRRRRMANVTDEG